MAKQGHFELAAGLLVLALLVGGAGVNFPILNMILGLGALGVAVAFLWRREPGLRLPLPSRLALLLMALMLALPTLQLVPLPPSLWQALPGREVPVQVDALLGAAPWRPWTLDVEGTMRSLLNLVPACVMLWLCLYLRTPARARLLVLVAAFAALNALLGIVQLASGGLMTPYPSSHSGYPIGLFVNRNHNAVFLLMAMPIIAALAADRAEHSSARGALVAGVLSLLTIVGVVVIATTSRMALLLLPAALLGSLALLFLRRSLWRLAIPSTLVIGAVAAAISWFGGFSRNLARFSSLQDSRFDYWTDVQWAVGHYGLAGTGLGTFVPVYQTAESLSSVGPAILNHAHNDFIELALEGGLPAILLLVAFFALLGVAALRLLKARFERRRALLSLAALVAIATVLLFSLVDYPLRMPAISCLFALLFACLLPEPEGEEQAGAARRADAAAGTATGLRAPRLAALAAFAGIGLLELQAGLSGASLLADRFAAARAWAPWSTEAREGLAAQALAARRPAEAMREARAAIALSPIDSVAIRSAALAGAAERERAGPDRLMQIAVLLGWRDPVAQMWAIAASRQTGEAEKAIQRAEALFQQELFPAPAIALLVDDAPNGPVARALVDALDKHPAWRPAFIAAGSALPPGELDRFVALATRLNRGRAPLGAVEAGPLLERLIESGRPQSARTLWTGMRRGSLISNGDFEQLASRGGADVPADWNLDDEDLATIIVQVPSGGGHGKALRISPGARSGPLLSQRLMLEPGVYRLFYRARAGADAGTRVRWQLRCSGSDLGMTAEQAVSAGRDWQPLAADLTVPIQDCPIQTLAVQRPNVIQAPELWIDDLVLKRVSDLRRVH